MKNQLLITLFVLFSLFSYSQIELEGSFDDRYYVGTISLTEHGDKVVLWDLAANYKLYLYNDDLSLFKEIIIPATYQGSPVLVESISNNLFNNDGKIEYLINEMDNGSHYSYLLNEDGDLINSFDGQSRIFSVNNKFKLLIFDDTHDYIYSLPGTLENPVNEKEFNQQSPYPNPSNSKIYLPVNNINTNASKVIIYNSAGQIVDEITELPGNGIYYSTHHLEPGMYLYKILANKIIQSKGKFIVR